MSEGVSDWIVREWTLRHPKGLHARPATLLVKATRDFSADVQLVFGEEVANCKSLFSLLSLCITDGSSFQVRARGADAEQALDAIVRLLDSAEFLG